MYVIVCCRSKKARTQWNEKLAPNTQNVFIIHGFAVACRWHGYYINIKIIISTDNSVQNRNQLLKWIVTHLDVSFLFYSRFSAAVAVAAIVGFVLWQISSYGWHRVVFFYERNGHYNVGGLHTCHLLMQTMAQAYRTNNITYSSFATDSAVGTNTTENLKREVGLDQASK